MNDIFTMQRIFKEFIVSMILGGGPMFIVATRDGGDKIVAYLGTLNPGDSIYMYFFTIFLYYMALSAMNIFFLKPTNDIASAISNMQKIGSEVGFAILEFYRVLTGAIPVMAVALILIRGIKGSGLLVSMSGIVFIVMLSACCILSWLKEKTPTR
jgi:hypothetical protein